MNMSTDDINNIHLFNKKRSQSIKFVFCVGIIFFTIQLIDHPDVMQILCTASKGMTLNDAWGSVLRPAGPKLIDIFIPYSPACLFELVAIFLLCWYFVSAK